MNITQLLNNIHSVLEETNGLQFTDANEPKPEIFKSIIDNAWILVRSVQKSNIFNHDRASTAAFTQIECTLKHVRLSYSRATNLYIHDDVLPGPYAFEPCREVLLSVYDIFTALTMRESIQPKVVKYVDFDAKMKELGDRHKKTVNSIIKDPVPAYIKFRDRLTKEGPNAKFPELNDTVQYLLLNMHSEEVMDCLRNSNILPTLHKSSVDRLIKMEREGLPYRKTIDAIENILSFLDIYVRSENRATPNPLYHSYRYQYYSFYLKSQTPHHIMFPIFEDIGATPLLKMRSVPISFLGTRFTTKWVDGYEQTPLEFWYHDVNHSRRMYQFSQEYARDRNITLVQLAETSQNFINLIMVPLITITKNDPEQVRDIKRMMKMIFFEILHEDALPATIDTIKRSLSRAPNTLTPFEHLIENETRVLYTMEPGATILAYVYRKLGGNFCDTPNEHHDYICGSMFRDRVSVAVAAKYISTYIDAEMSQEINVKHVHSDEGLPDDFRMQVQKLMDGNPGLMVPFSDQSNDH